MFCAQIIILGILVIIPLFYSLSNRNESRHIVLSLSFRHLNNEISNNHELRLAYHKQLNRQYWVNELWN